jgi:hypothetical protein
MNKQTTHIIHKLNLEIEARSEGEARYLYDHAGDILQQYVLPELELLLRRYGQADEHIRLDKLDINLDAINGPGEELKDRLAEAIAGRLSKVIQKETGADGREKNMPRRSSGPQQLINAFLFFLEKGTLPWWLADPAPLSSSNDIIGAIVQQEEQFVTLFLKAITGTNVLDRLLQQYDAVLLHYLFSLAAPLPVLKLAVDQETAWMAEAPLFPEAGKQQYWSMVWRLFPVEELAITTEEAFRERLEAVMTRSSRHAAEQGPDRDMVETETGEKEDSRKIISAGEIEAKEAESLQQQETPVKDDNSNAGKPETKESELLIANAGLILLHPFLQYFFLELELLDDTQFKDREARDTAIHLLHYLATGKEQEADFDLVFEKYLCGMPLSGTTYRYTQLSDKMKTESGTLLASVIRHWQALKNTSSAGLQEAFLQRKGKLMLRGENHRLLMEQNAMDILLTQLPWSISLVKLPWLARLIQVEWIT